MLAWERFLGSDDCETCGTNFDGITLEWAFDLNLWELRVSVGCYGGGSANGPSAEVLDYVTTNWSHLLTSQDLADFKRVLKSAVPQSWTFPAGLSDDPEDRVGVLEVQRLDDNWEGWLDAKVDDAFEYRSSEGPWRTVRGWILTEIGPEYLNPGEAEKLITEVESAMR